MQLLEQGVQSVPGPSRTHATSSQAQIKNHDMDAEDPVAIYHTIYLFIVHCLLTLFVHVICDIKLFTSHVTHISTFVQLPDSTKLHVTMKGTIHILDKIILTDVLYVLLLQ